ncbi:MAG: hypothetical protein AAF423_01250 [Pseudomonadota bacterium]
MENFETYEFVIGGNLESDIKIVGVDIQYRVRNDDAVGAVLRDSIGMLGDIHRHLEFYSLTPGGRFANEGLNAQAFSRQAALTDNEEFQVNKKWRLTANISNLEQSIARAHNADLLFGDSNSVTVTLIVSLSIKTTMTTSGSAATISCEFQLNLQRPDYDTRDVSPSLFEDLESQNNSGADSVLNVDRARFNPFLDDSALPAGLDPAKGASGCINRVTASSSTEYLVDLDAPNRLRLEPLAFFRINSNYDDEELPASQTEFDLEFGAFWNEQGETVNGVAWKEVVTVHELAFYDGYWFPRQIASLKNSISSKNILKYILPPESDCVVCLDLSVLGYNLQNFAEKYSQFDQSANRLRLVYSNPKSEESGFVDFILRFKNSETQRLILTNESAERALSCPYNGTRTTDTFILPLENGANGQQFQIDFENMEDEALKGLNLEILEEDNQVVEVLELIRSDSVSGLQVIPKNYDITEDCIGVQVKREGETVLKFLTFTYSSQEHLVGFDLGTQAIAGAIGSSEDDNVEMLRFGELLDDHSDGVKIKPRTDEVGEAFFLGARFALSKPDKDGGGAKAPVIDLINPGGRRSSAYRELDPAKQDDRLSIMLGRTSIWKENYDLHTALDADYEADNRFHLMPDVKMPIGAGEELKYAGEYYTSPNSDGDVVEAFHNCSTGPLPYSITLPEVKTQDILESVFKTVLLGLLPQVSYSAGTDERSSGQDIFHKMARHSNDRLVVTATYPASFSSSARRRYRLALTESVEILREEYGFYGATFVHLVPEGLAAIYAIREEIKSKVGSNPNVVCVLDIGAGTIDISAMNVLNSGDELSFLSQGLSCSIPLGGRLLDEAIEQEILAESEVSGDLSDVWGELNLRKKIEHSKRCMTATQNIIAIPLGHESYEVSEAVFSKLPKDRPIFVKGEGAKKFCYVNLGMLLENQSRFIAEYFRSIKKFVFYPILSWLNDRDRSADAETSVPPVLVLMGRCGNFHPFRLALIEVRDQVFAGCNVQIVDHTGEEINVASCSLSAMKQVSAKSMLAEGAVRFTKSISMAHRKESLPDAGSIYEHYCFVVGALNESGTEFLDHVEFIIPLYANFSRQKIYIPDGCQLHLAHVVPYGAWLDVLENWKSLRDGFGELDPVRRNFRHCLNTKVLRPVNVLWIGDKKGYWPKGSASHYNQPSVIVPTPANGASEIRFEYRLPDQALHGVGRVQAYCAADNELLVNGFLRLEGTFVC